MLGFKMGAAIAAALGLSACVKLGGAEAPESLFTLSASVSHPADAKQVEGAFIVPEPQVPQVLNVTRIPVQVSDTSLAYLKDAVWVERPSRLFQWVLAETLATKTGRIVLEQASPVIDPAKTKVVRISGELQKFSYDARTSSVVVRFDGRKEVLKAEGAASGLQTRRFEAVIPGVEAKAGPVAEALNRAANVVAAQVSDWAAE